MTIDTLAIARDLKAAELPPAQAEAIAAAIGHSINAGSATRSDLLLAKQELQTETGLLRSDLKEFESKVDAKIESLRSTLTLWFVGTGLTLSAVIIAAVKL